ncbi:serine protease 33-like [Urocitellus parryii]|uniref:serine protease 33-like n=1 Tax=Urocitellus parryii TaxID=9999 RepID=UPI000E558B0E|nr:serine protease 33-like [Urocitellus parryii]
MGLCPRKSAQDLRWEPSIAQFPLLSPQVQISRNRSSCSQVRRQAGASCLRGLRRRNPCQGHWLGNEQAGSGLQKDTAGLSPFVGNTRRPAVPSGIFSGLEANIGQWPWQVSVRQGFLHICSASLISQKWVLTMASCFRSKDTREYNVLMGSLQISGHPDPKERIIPVSRIISHPDFQGDVSSTIVPARLPWALSSSHLSALC